LRANVKILLLIVASLVILAVVVLVTGPAKTLAAVQRAGLTAFVAVGVTMLATLLLRAAAWSVLKVSTGHRVPFRTLLAAETLGQAGNILTPSSYLGGEPLKVIYVGRAVPHRYREIAGTVLLGKYLEVISFLLASGLGTTAVLVVFRDVLVSSYPGLGAGLLAMTGLWLGLSIVLLVSLRRGWRPLTRLVRLMGRTGLFTRFFGRLAYRTRRMEEHVSRVIRQERGAPRWAFALYLALHAVIIVRPGVFFWFGGHVVMGPGELCLIFVASQMLLFFQLTPSGVGTLDGGMIGVFAMLGLGQGDCMAFLLCLRLWDGVVIGAGALLATRTGAQILAARPRGVPEALQDDADPEARPGQGRHGLPDGPTTS